MTNEEKKILENYEAQQGQLSAELASRSSFIGAIATLAAFLAIQWGRSTPHAAVAIILYFAIAVSFVLLLIASIGHKYLYPAPPSEWFAWLLRREHTLRDTGIECNSVTEKAESDLRNAFLRAAQRRAETNRKSNKNKAALLSASGAVAVLAVLTILVLEVLSTAGLF